MSPGLLTSKFLSLRGLGSGRAGVVMSLVRTVVNAVRGFVHDKCPLWSSALTFYATLSIVPVAAMAFGIAKGFGLESMLRTQLVEKFPEQQEAIKFIIDFAENLLKNTRGEMVAGIGVVVLFWSVIKVLENIESSFNAIWGVAKGRPFLRKASDYLAMMLVCPIFVIASGSITVYVSTHLMSLSSRVEVLHAFSPLMALSLKALPYVMVWAMFSFIYIIIPNTRVNYKSGILAGIVAGTLYQLLQAGYIFLQMSLSSYNAIYGSFSALPLFLVWMQLNWTIVLFGAEISYADQNAENLKFDVDRDRPLSNRSLKAAAMKILGMLARNFESCGAPVGDAEIADSLKTDLRTVREILAKCAAAGLINEVADERGNGCRRYQPAFDTKKLTVWRICDALDAVGADIDERSEAGSEFRGFSQALHEAGEHLRNSRHDRRVDEI